MDFRRGDFTESSRQRQGEQSTREVETIIGDTPCEPSLWDFKAIPTWGRSAFLKAPYLAKALRPSSVAHFAAGTVRDRLENSSSPQPGKIYGPFVYKPGYVSKLPGELGLHWVPVPFPGQE